MIMYMYCEGEDFLGPKKSIFTLLMINHIVKEREDIGAPRPSLFSLRMIRYIVEERTLELLDTPYSPLA